MYVPSFGRLFHTPTPHQREAEVKQESIEKIKEVVEEHRKNSDSFQKSIEGINQKCTQQTHEKHEQLINNIKNSSKLKEKL